MPVRLWNGIHAHFAALDSNLGVGFGTLRRMKLIHSGSALASLVLMAGFATSCSALAQTAGQDMHTAGHDTRNAADDTGHAVKTGTRKTYHATARTTRTATHKTVHATRTVAHKTADGTRTATDKTVDGTKHVFGH